VAGLQEQRICFLGLGLISGSLAMALRDSGWSGERVAWGPREPSLKRGLELGVIDRYSLELEQAVKDADMVVVGAPPVATGELLSTLLPQLPAHTVVTDLASIKGWVIEQVQAEHPGFVPGHPIAGSENSGVAAASADLFRGREVILTPLDYTDAQATERVRQLWLQVGARVSLMTVTEHDTALAASSHMPHMAAYALTKALAKHELQPMQHGGGALRDMTRIAGSDPLMWRDIVLTNREAVLQAMGQFRAEIESLEALIAAGEGPALETYFAQCRQQRRAHDEVLNPLAPKAMKDPDNSKTGESE